jgi:DNA polymerase family A
MLAVNFEVQGCGADALKIALVRLYQHFANSPTRILLPLHDAILIQTPEAEADAVAETVSQTMREAFHEILGPIFPWLSRPTFRAGGERRTHETTTAIDTHPP